MDSSRSFPRWLTVGAAMVISFLAFAQKGWAQG
jgi:hypothetical protein